MECALQMLLPHGWHCSIDIGILWFLLLLGQLSSCNLHPFFLPPVHLYLFPIFGTGLGTLSAIVRNIFIFNWTIDVKLCNFRLQTWVNAEALVRFYPKRYDENFEISSLCFKHQMSFHLPRNCQACKSHNEARFCPCSVKVFQLNTMSVPPLVRICGFPLPSLIFFFHVKDGMLTTQQRFFCSFTWFWLYMT